MPLRHLANAQPQSGRPAEHRFQSQPGQVPMTATVITLKGACRPKRLRPPSRAVSACSPRPNSKSSSCLTPSDKPAASARHEAKFAAQYAKLLDPRRRGPRPGPAKTTPVQRDPQVCADQVLAEELNRHYTRSMLIPPSSRSRITTTRTPRSTKKSTLQRIIIPHNARTTADGANKPKPTES